MKEEISELVYKCPGPHRGPRGKSYAYKAVKTEEEYLEAIEDGWFATLGDAVNGEHSVVEAPSKVVDKEEEEVDSEEKEIDFPEKEITTEIPKKKKRGRKKKDK